MCVVLFVDVLLGHQHSSHVIDAVAHGLILVLIDSGVA